MLAAGGVAAVHHLLTLPAQAARHRPSLIRRAGERSGAGSSRAPPRLISSCETPRRLLNDKAFRAEMCAGVGGGRSRRPKTAMSHGAGARGGIDPEWCEIYPDGTAYAGAVAFASRPASRARGGHSLTGAADCAVICLVESERRLAADLQPISSSRTAQSAAFLLSCRRECVGFVQRNLALSLSSRAFRGPSSGSTQSILIAALDVWTAKTTP